VTAKSIALFVVAAAAEIGGAYLMWQAIKEDRGIIFAAAGAAALTGYGAVAALQPDANFGRVLAAYGGVFIVGSLIWGMIFDGFQPDRYDIAGAIACLIGIAVIMYAPR
jgi:small multidrug resistance family-3 protein